MKQLVIRTRLTNRESESFQKYLSEIAQIPVFTQQEEIACTARSANGDKKATEELVKRNLRFVVSVAKQYSTPINPVEDLVNEGNIGLILAAQKFKPEMGFRFISYAVWWVRKKILEHLAKDGRMVRLPANKLGSLSKLDRKISEMEQRLGRSVDIQELIVEFDGQFDAEAIELLGVLNTYSMDSIDREIGGEDGTGTTLGDMLSDDTIFEAPDASLMNNDVKSDIMRMLDVLKPRDKRIMIALYGLNGDSPMTLKEVGDEVGVTREMIRQIKVKVLATLKDKIVNSHISNN
jgi:RNA polymerase primary sigma factor